MSNLQTDRQVPTVAGLDTPFHVAAEIAVSKAMDEISNNWDGSLSGHDVEAVHDLRVGTRRLRAALSVYEDAFPPREFRRIERAMSSLTDALGPARDTDVLIEHLKSVIDSIEAGHEAERVGLQLYVDHLVLQREDQQVGLIRAMTKTDLDQVRSDLETVSAGLPDSL